MIMCYMNIEISAIALSGTCGMLLQCYLYSKFLKGIVIQYHVRFTMFQYFKHKKTYAHKIKHRKS